MALTNLHSGCDQGFVEALRICLHNDVRARCRLEIPPLAPKS